MCTQHILPLIFFFVLQSHLLCQSLWTHGDTPGALYSPLGLRAPGLRDMYCPEDHQSCEEDLGMESCLLCLIHKPMGKIAVTGKLNWGQNVYASNVRHGYISSIHWISWEILKHFEQRNIKRLFQEAYGVRFGFGVCVCGGGWILRMRNIWAQGKESRELLVSQLCRVHTQEPGREMTWCHWWPLVCPTQALCMLLLLPSHSPGCSLLLLVVKREGCISF